MKLAGVPALLAVALCLVTGMLGGSPHLQAINNQVKLAPDYNALMAFYHATNGLEWTSSQYWMDVDVQYCEWEGVTCDAQGHVTELILESNNLRGSFPKELATLQSLVTLDLSNNEGLGGSMPVEWGALVQLKELLLFNTQLAGTIPSEIGKLAQLQWLDFDTTLLAGTIPSEIGKLAQLQKLWLFNTQLTGTIPSEIGNLTQLRNLYLFNTQLSGTIPSEIGNLTQLEGLWLYKTQLSGTIPSDIGNLAQLEGLWLYKTQLSGTIPSDIGNLTQLRGLGLYKTQLAGTIPSEIGNLVQLQKLELYYTQLSGTIPHEIGKLIQLQWLYLNDNQLTGIIPSEIGNLVQLQELGLFNNQLTGTIPSEIGNLVQLQCLYLQNTVLTGTIPKEIGKLVQLQWLALNNIQLSGTIPSELGNLRELQGLMLANTLLTGIIPSEIGKLVQLQQLDISATYLSGTIPVAFNALQHLQNLIASSSLITSIEFDISALFQLQVLDLSGCPLQHVSFLATPCVSSSMKRLDLSNTRLGTAFDLRGFSKLNMLNVNHNRIPSSIKDFLNALPPSLEALYANEALVDGGEWSYTGEYFLQNLQKALIVALSGNHISGPLMEYSGASKFLVSLDFSHNELSGYISESIAARLMQLSVNGNPDMRSRTRTMPTFAVLDTSTRLEHGDGSYTCWGLKGVNTTRLESVHLDPVYYNYEGCTCSEGYTGKAPECMRCPPSIRELGKCEDGQVYIPKGYYPSPEGEPSLASANATLVLCPAADRSKSACNPQQTAKMSFPGFSCAPHNLGRLCSVCEAGYTMSGALCQACVATWVQVVLGIGGIVFVLIMAVRAKPKASATSSIGIFYVQMLVTLLSRVSWPQHGASHAAISGLSMLSGAKWHTGLDCLGLGSPKDLNDFSQQYQAKFSIVIFSPLLVLACAGVGWGLIRLVLALLHWLSLWNDRSPNAAVSGDIHQVSRSATGRLLVMTLYVLLYYYINISTAALEVLRCTGHGYMLNAPAIRCEQTGLWGTYLMPVAVIMLVVFVFGLPVGVAVVLVRGRGRPAEAEVSTRGALWHAADYMTGSYRDSCFYFQVFAYIRRLLVVLVLSVVSVESEWEPLFICMLLLGFFALHLVMTPYRLKRDNMLESASLAALLISYAAAFVQETALHDATPRRANLQLFVVVLNVSIGVVMVVMALASLKWPPWLSPKLRRRGAFQRRAADLKRIQMKETSLSMALSEQLLP